MKKVIISSSIIAVILLAVVSLANRTPKAEGSVAQGGAYNFFVTAPVQGNTSYLQNTTVGSTSSGTLGSVVITGPASGTFTLYDSTTSYATLRALATSSLPVLANFPPNTATGTYTFDEKYVNGIVVEFTGTVPTTTITWRPY